MGRILVVNDEQKIMNILFSRQEVGGDDVDFASTLEEAKRLAAEREYDAAVLQVAPSSQLLDGGTMEEFVDRASAEIPAKEVFWVTNFRGIRRKTDAAAFGASDFIISGSLLKAFISASVSQAREAATDQADKKNLKGSIVALANVFQSLLDLEDPFLKGNIEFIVACSRQIAADLDLPRDVVDGTEVAASLYDIGKIGVQKELLWKKSSLDLRQQDIIHAHPVVACELLKDVPFPWEVIPIIRHHHERFDGEGYPDGLRGREIPIGARILAVVDAFHAMISQRPYRSGLSIEDAFNEINRNAGVQFDPEVVEVFFDVARDYFARNPPKHAFKALLVDDDIKYLAKLKMALELEGYEVITAKNFEHGERMADAQHPDLVVSDLSLGNGDGFAFFDHVKGQAGMEDTVFMFVSSTNAPEDRIEAYRKGADDFLAKPYEIGELVLKLGNLLRRVRKGREIVPEIPKNGLMGTLKDFGLPDLLQILNYGVKTALVTVKDGDGVGKIYVEEGRVKFVNVGSLNGQDALLELFQWEDGSFSIEHGVSVDKTNVSLDSPILILETLRRLDDVRRTGGNGSSLRRSSAAIDQ